MEFRDKVRLDAHHKKKRLYGPDVYDSPDNDLPEFDEDSHESETCINCGRKGHSYDTFSQEVDCYECLQSKHFSRRCEDCRPPTD